MRLHQTPESMYAARALTPKALRRADSFLQKQISDSQGQLQYIPFYTCNETNRSLELYFGVEEAITDPLFHLLEFYIHNDAPLTCRIPSHPLSTIDGSAALTPTQDDYIPLIFALAGTLQLSHVHVNPLLNVVLHTSPDLVNEDADILAATAYSVPSLSTHATKIVIGDPLPLQLSVRWYTSPTLPPSTTSPPSGLGGHVHFSTVIYCLLSAGVGVAASLAYWRGVELPRRIKRYGKERVGGGTERGYAWPGGGGTTMNGYGYGIGSGKRD
ncbi:hypothetical protein MMC20_001864 [Loxospora ochrophaea]|nr:hypothetical protein [Loxospora ochrophaea]